MILALQICPRKKKSAKRATGMGIKTASASTTTTANIRMMTSTTKVRADDSVAA
jgi:hypothetical protein